MKVLFCTDGSEASYYAIEKTLIFLKQDAKIDIFTVIDWGILPTYVTFPHEEEEGLPNQRNNAQQILDQTKKLIESKGYKINESAYASGHPANVILDIIAKNNYDLVSMGSHGKKGVSKWLGSVSRKVVTGSPVPTLIARPPKQTETVTLKGSKDVLIAADGSSYSYNAIRKMVEILDLENSEIEILTVRPGAEALPVEITMDTEWLENSLAKQKEIASEVLEESKKILEMNGIKPTNTLSLEGNAAEQILDYTEKNKKDLIIMGSHGREGISEFLLGSVSKRVLDHSESPVLIIPTKKTGLHHSHFTT